MISRRVNWSIRNNNKLQGRRGVKAQGGTGQEKRRIARLHGGEDR